MRLDFEKVSKIARKVLSGILFYVRLPGKILKLKSIVSQPSYYPEFERKSDFERWMDNFKWLMKNREINSLYTGYGLDINGFRNPEDFVPHREFIRERDAGVKTKRASYGTAFNEVILVRDKYVFSAYMEATVGVKAIPETIGLIENDRVFLHATKTWIQLTEFCHSNFRYVFKNIDGTYGDGVRLITSENGRIQYSGENHSIAEFVESCMGQRILIQQLIIQHEALRAFKTSCVNTIRAITIRGKSGKTELFAAFLRVGNDSDTFVDNRAKGGLAVGVDLDTGRLMKYGYPHERFGTKTEIHPLSGIIFEGYQLPFWKETVDLVINAHMQFPDMATIGWDVTMTDEGPLIVEANDCWEISGPQDTYGGLKERWNRLRNQ